MPRILVSEVDGLRRYEPELLVDNHRMVLAQECAELIEGRWESFMTLPQAVRA
jgi:hypothetical protein